MEKCIDLSGNEEVRYRHVYREVRQALGPNAPGFSLVSEGPRQYRLLIQAATPQSLPPTVSCLGQTFTIC